MNIIQDTLEHLKLSNCNTDGTFFQAVKEVLESIAPLIESNKKYQDNCLISLKNINDYVDCIC